MTFPNFTDNPDFSGAPGYGDSILIQRTAVIIPTGNTVYPAAPGVGPLWYVLNQPAIMLVFSAPVGMTGFINLAFYADPKGLENCGSITYTKAIQAGALVDVVTPLGPYMLIEFNNTGFAATESFIVAQTSQTPGGCLGGINAAQAGRVLAFFANGNINANSELNIVPALTVPGPAVLQLRGSGNVGEARLQFTAGVYSGEVFAGVAVTTASPSWATAEIVIPNDDWIMTVLNNGAANNNFAAAVTTLR